MKRNLVRIIPETKERRIKQSEPSVRFSFSKTSRNILALVFVFFKISKSHKPMIFQNLVQVILFLTIPCQILKR